MGMCQNTIVGQIKDYEDSTRNIGLVLVTIDTSIASITFAKNGVISAVDGLFKIQCETSSLNNCLRFTQGGYEILIICGIKFNKYDTINIGTVYLLPGSYEWDGYCYKKIFFGLFRKKWECGGHKSGYLENHGYPDKINISYPKGKKNKNFNIIDRTLIIDYKEFKT